MTPKEKNDKIIDSYDYLGNSASSMDCTGLIPSAPQSSAEIESYNDIYSFMPPKVKEKKSNSDSSKK